MLVGQTWALPAADKVPTPGLTVTEETPETFQFKEEQAPELTLAGFAMKLLIIGVGEDGCRQAIQKINGNIRTTHIEYLLKFIPLPHINLILDL